MTENPNHPANRNQLDESHDPIKVNPVDALFSEIYGNLKKEKVEESEIVLHSTPDPKVVRLMFDEIASSLSPKRSKEKIAKMVTSDQRKIEATDIAKKATATAKIVRVIETEKKKKAMAERLRRQQQRADQRIILKPPFMDRVGSALIDFLACCLLSCIFAAGLAFLLWPDAALSLFSGEIQEHKMAQLLSLLLGALPTVTIAYNLVFLVMKRRTLGMSFASITITDPFGDRAPTRNLVVKSFASPASFILLGFLSPLLGKRSFSDLLAETRLIQEYSSIEEPARDN